MRIQVDDREPFDVALDERSLLAGQLVSFPATDGPATVRISLGDTAGGTPGYVDRTLVGFAEADFGIGMSPEVIRTPTDMTTAMRDGGVDAPVTYALTRERVRPTNRWRDDPEARIVARHRRAGGAVGRHRRRRFASTPAPPTRRWPPSSASRGRGRRYA